MKDGMKFERRGPEFSECGRYEIFEQDGEWNARFAHLDGAPWLIVDCTYEEAVVACERAEVDRVRSVQESKTCERCKVYGHGQRVDRRRPFLPLAGK